MVTEKQRKARENFIKKYAGKKAQRKAVARGTGKSRTHFVTDSEMKIIKRKMRFMALEIDRLKKRK